MKNKQFFQSFNNAFNGIMYVIKTERNMRFHIFAAALVCILSLFFDLTKTELIVVCATISLVLISELINTALEVVVNVIIKVYHPQAKIIKDVAAGAVLLSAINSLVVGYFIFYDRIGSGLEKVIIRVKHYQINMTVMSLVITLVMVFAIKTLTKKGTPFQGGMPSGHSAIAFSITTAVALWTNNMTITILCIVLAFLVAQSRVEAKIHTVIEVLLGGVLGFLTTLIFFKLLQG